MTAKIIVGDCLDAMRGMEDCSIDAVVTDPPAGISFMNTAWDHHKGGRDNWIAWLTEVMREALRLAKPGAHAFVWALPRTSGWTHRAIEDAGWEIRDCATHIFGSGFPKSLDISKQLDKTAGVERDITRNGQTKAHEYAGKFDQATSGLRERRDSPATDLAREWDGWGTALKPAAEFWYLARKPLSGSVAANVTAWGVGGLNIDGCRIEHDEPIKVMQAQPKYNKFYGQGGRHEETTELKANGRWPANLLLDEAAAAALDAMSGELHSGNPKVHRLGVNASAAYGAESRKPGTPLVGYGDTGGASRFYLTVSADCWLCEGQKHDIMNETQIGDDELCSSIAKNAEHHSKPISERNDSALADAQGLLPLVIVDSSRNNTSPALTAATTSTLGSETIGNTVPLNAQPPLPDNLVQRVKSAGSLCDLCATAIARNLAAMQLGQSPELAAGQGYMHETKRNILNQSLALFAESLGNTGTILTTASLTILFGYVRHVIDESINKASPAQNIESELRFRYTSKASRAERTQGGASGKHPTQKPIDLMQWLCRLICPPNGTVLDPFAGSGTTGVAADREGFHSILIEQDPDYAEDARRKIIGDAPLFAEVEP